MAEADHPFRVRKSDRNPEDVQREVLSVLDQWMRKVIGAKQVNYQGRQLNQIKVLMPNGRIIIHQRLFDEKGRSVETVHADEAGSDPKAKLTDR